MPPRDPRLQKLMSTGQARFARGNNVNNNNKPAADYENGEVPVTVTDTTPPQAGKRAPHTTTPDSGFSEAAVAVVHPAVTTKSPIPQTPSDNEGDYGTSSVIHVNEPDTSGARWSWHTRGYTSDPYADGTLHPPDPLPRSKAGLEAEETARRAAKDRASRRGNPGNPAQVEPLLQTIPIRPTTSTSTSTSQDIPRPYSSREAINRATLSSRGRPRPPASSTSVRSHGNGSGQRLSDGDYPSGTLGSWIRKDITPASGGADGQVKRRGSERRQGVGSDRNTRNKPPDNNSKSTRTTAKGNRITPPHRPAVVKQRQPQPSALKGSQRPNQDIRSNRSTSQAESSRKKADGKRSTTPVKPVTDSQCLAPSVGKSIKKQNSNVNSNGDATATGADVAVSRVSPGTSTRVTSSSLELSSAQRTTILIKRPQHRRRSLGTAEEITNENVEISTLAFMREDQGGRVRSPRKVSFNTARHAAVRNMTPTEEEKETGNIRPHPPISEPKRRRKRVVRMAVKKDGARKPTQREMDDDFICGVAAANRYSRQGQHPEMINQNLVTSESEEEEEETGEPPQPPKSSWELFEDQVKSIDDSTMYFSPRDLTSKSSDLFEKVMVQIGPQFRKPKEDEASELSDVSGGGGGAALEEMEEDVFESAGEVSVKGPVSALSRFRSKQGWGLLRKQMLDKQMDSAKNTEASSLNWRFLCTTINNLTDMQRGREALYQKYIYEPNSWLKGFTNIPTNIIKPSQRPGGKNKGWSGEHPDGYSLRNVQSANGQRIVTVGHQADERDPNNAEQLLHKPRVKGRAWSTQGRVRVASHNKPPTVARK